MLSPKFAMIGIRTAVLAFFAAFVAVVTGLPLKKKVNRSRYMPHQGKAEMARRRRRAMLQGI
jgi:hypothetical protein